VTSTPRRRDQTVTLPTTHTSRSSYTSNLYIVTSLLPTHHYKWLLFILYAPPPSTTAWRGVGCK
jgi:hypothetical protein